MKKILLLLALFVFTSCGSGVAHNEIDEDSSVNDTHNDATQDNEVIDTVQDSEVTDEDTTTVDESETPDDGQLQKTGEFDLSFDGQINVDLSNYQNIKGGKGEVNFSHNGTDFTYGELTVVIVQLFPIAILQQGNVAILWLESAPGMGAETKQVFGFTYPATMTTPGDYNMEDIQAYAFYGDINIDLQNSVFEVKCIRSAAIAGSANFTKATADWATLTASGDLLDPSVAASQLPYPICED